MHTWFANCLVGKEQAQLVKFCFVSAILGGLSIWKWCSYWIISIHNEPGEMPLSLFMCTMWRIFICILWCSQLNWFNCASEKSIQLFFLKIPASWICVKLINSVCSSPGGFVNVNGSLLLHRGCLLEVRIKPGFFSSIWKKPTVMYFLCTG